jgi:hypothetical protein
MVDPNEESVRGRIIAALASCGSTTSKVLAIYARRGIRTTRAHLRKLLREGKIQKVRCHVGEGIRGAFMLYRLQENKETEHGD